VEYDAYGQLLSNRVESREFLYNGKQFNDQTKLYNYGFRDYNASTARFTTVDPIRDGDNWFVYVGGEPVGRVDLWGLQEIIKSPIQELDDRLTSVLYILSGGNEEQALRMKEEIYDRIVGELSLNYIQYLEREAEKPKSPQFESLLENLLAIEDSFSDLEDSLSELEKTIESDDNIFKSLGENLKNLSDAWSDLVNISPENDDRENGDEEKKEG
jgi:RHS repeat-associated protein